MRTAKASGFTLSEIMIAVTLAVICIGMVMAFYIQILRSTVRNEQRLNIDQAMRQALGVLSKAAIDATRMYVVTNRNSIDNDIVLDPTVRATTPHDDLDQGLSGDCLILIYRDNYLNQALTTRIKIVYRESTALATPSRLRMFEYDVPSGQQAVAVNTLIRNLSGNISGLQGRVLLERCVGIVSGGTRLPVFYVHQPSAQGSDVQIAVNLYVHSDAGHGQLASTSSTNYIISARN